jgi:hypothetical protein
VGGIRFVLGSGERMAIFCLLVVVVLGAGGEREEGDTSPLEHCAPSPHRASSSFLFCSTKAEQRWCVVPIIDDHL